MNTVTSKDGTRIAYEKHGNGPPVILVDGALGYRLLGFDNPLAERLSQHFTVYEYDRRGRGESTNSKPFAIEREVEDIDALINAAGGEAYVYGISSGACLALEAAIILGKKIIKLAIYEPPYNSDPSALPAWKDYWNRLVQLVSDDRRSEAVELFMHYVGTPAKMIEGMENSPVWAALTSVAPTLPYDAAAMGQGLSVPAGRVASVTSQTLVLDGGLNMKYIPFMHATALELARAIPNAVQRTLQGQSHDVKAEALAPVLVEFFTQ
jgi:pimeloyl-ACP methyl ester carboxylesterase